MARICGRDCRQFRKYRKNNFMERKRVFFYFNINNKTKNKLFKVSLITGILKNQTN